MIGVGLGVGRLQHIKSSEPSDGPAAGDGLLLETALDSFLLLETGDYLLLE